MNKNLLTITICLVGTLSLAQPCIDPAANYVRGRVCSPCEKVDAIGNDFNSSADSLHQTYLDAGSEIDRQAKIVQSKLDSLHSLNLSSTKLSRTRDSLHQEKEKLQRQIEEKLHKLKAATLGRIQKMQLTPGMEGPVKEFSARVEVLSLTDNALTRIAPIELPDVSMPDLAALNASLPNFDAFTEIETPLNSIGEIANDAAGLTQDATAIANGDFEPGNLSNTIERRVENLDALKVLNEQYAILDEYKQLGMFRDPDAIKTQVIALAKKHAIDHFVGKETALTHAIGKLSTFKEKYNSVSRIKELPKRIPNAMKGKPLVERLVPGIYFQYQKSNVLLVDFNPYVGYRLSGMFTLGAGWNQRLAYDRMKHIFNNEHAVWGPRLFLDTRFPKGTILHLETEAMNTLVPNEAWLAIEPRDRQWIRSVMAGIKKEYTICGNLRGTVLLQYNFVNEYFKTPYLDRVSSRMGFEWMLRKRKMKT